MMKSDFDPCTERWSVYLPDEPGKPRIEADDRETLLRFLEEHALTEGKTRIKRMVLDA